MALLKIKDTDGTWKAQGNVGVFGSSDSREWVLIDEIILSEDAAYYFKDGFDYTDILVNIIHTTGNYGSDNNRFYYRFSDNASESDIQGVFKVRLNSSQNNWMKYSTCLCSKISDSLYYGNVTGNANDTSESNTTCFVPTTNGQPTTVSSLGAFKLQMETGNLLAGTKIQVFGR